jgi:hypothetical protein
MPVGGFLDLLRSGRVQGVLTMSAKGSGNCCCDGCEERAMDSFNAITGGFGASERPEVIQRIQQYCCSCIPQSLCLTMSSEDGTYVVSGFFERYCQHYGTDDEFILFTGSVLYHDAEVDFSILFRIADAKCFLCMRSAFLGITGNDYCVRLTPDERQKRACQDFNTLNRGGEIGQWSVDTGGNWGTVIVGIVASTHEPIENRQPCVDRYGERVRDTNPIKNLCADCRCICRKVCITVLRDGRATTETVELDGASWTMSSGLAISLVANYPSGCCELELTASGSGMTLLSSPPNVAIGSRTAENKCPRPEGKWSSSEISLETGIESPVLILLSCSDCIGCRVGKGTTCCNGQVPKVLTAELTITHCASCITSLLVSLVWDKIIGEWVGTLPHKATNVTFCQRDIRVSLTCGTPWIVRVSNSPCGDYTATATLESCDVIDLSFQSQTVSGGNCCEPPVIVDTMVVNDPDNVTLSVRVTE